MPTCREAQMARGSMGGPDGILTCPRASHCIGGFSSYSLTKLIFGPERC